MARGVVSGWKTGVVSPGKALPELSSPAPIRRGSTSAPTCNRRPSRWKVPQSFSSLYDGKTRSRCPRTGEKGPREHFLNVQPGRFSAASRQRANGNTVRRQLLVGTAALDYGVLRDNCRGNFDLIVRRTFRVTERSRWLFLRGLSSWPLFLNHLNSAEPPGAGGPTSR